MIMYNKYKNKPIGFEMEKLLIRLKTINDIRAFVDTTSTFKSTVILTCGNFSVSGKSIMGIFSLDLSKPIVMEVYTDSCDDLMEDIKPFMA